MMIIFIFSSVVRLLAGNGARPTIWLLVVPLGWLALRIAVQSSRRRASVALRALGNPMPTRQHAAKGEFPVPITQANEVGRLFRFSRMVAPFSQVVAPLR